LQNNISKYINEIPTQNNQRDKAEQYRNELYNAYNLAAQAVSKNFDLYKSTSRNSNEQIIENLISETYNTTRLVAEAIKAIDNYLDFVQNTLEKEQTPLPPLMSTQQSNINSYTSKINNYLLNLLAAQNTIKDSKDTIEDSERKIKVLQQNNPLDLAAAQRNIEQSQKALDKLKKGPDELEIRAKKIAVQQKQNALEDARKNLADHYIRAPFSGIISKVNVKKGDVVSTGTIIATLITDQKIAEISLNEVDAAKVKIGQKATLTFDAFPGLTISGQVAEIDTVGTVSQGVVSYNVKINFDTQDEEIKPGMSVSAAIIIEAKPDALLIPNSAIKSQGQTNYVEMPDDNELNLAKANPNGAAFKNPLKRQMVEIGLANDEFTEIISGLREGDIIVTKIIQPNNSKPAQQQQNNFRIPGLPTGGGGFRR
jgi:HlyD family secretion protein